MIYLHDGGGAGITEVLGQHMGDDEWTTLRRQAIRLMKARNHFQAAGALEEYAFSLEDGTNVFGDEFCLLRVAVPIEQYVALEELKASSRDAFQQIAKTLTEIGPFVRFIVAVLDDGETVEAVKPPSLARTTESVERALADAQQLIQTQGPASAVDRVHTAVHGYLRVVCDAAELSMPRNASITDVFKILRDQHPTLQELGARSNDLRRIILSAATIVDAVNVLRNQASVAHPNDALLEDAEAMLAINAARSLLHYLDAKLGSTA